MANNATQREPCTCGSIAGLIVINSTCPRHFPENNPFKPVRFNEAYNRGLARPQLYGDRIHSYSSDSTRSTGHLFKPPRSWNAEQKRPPAPLPKKLKLEQESRRRPVWELWLKNRRPRRNIRPAYYLDLLEPDLMDMIIKML